MSVTKRVIEEIEALEDAGDYSAAEELRHRAFDPPAAEPVEIEDMTTSVETRNVTTSVEIQRTSVTAGDEKPEESWCGNGMIVPDDHDGHVPLPVPAAAARVFSIVQLFVPDRISREDIGDASERITALGLTGWPQRFKLASTVIWVLLNAIREAVACGLGRDRKRSE